MPVDVYIKSEKIDGGLGVQKRKEESHILPHSVTVHNPGLSIFYNRPHSKYQLNSSYLRFHQFPQQPSIGICTCKCNPSPNINRYSNVPVPVWRLSSGVSPSY